MTELGPGATLYGYCEGVWGSYSLSNKIVVASGAGWLVAKDTHTDRFLLAQGDDIEILERHTTPESKEDWE
jgi:hypothetical protein